MVSPSPVFRLALQPWTFAQCYIAWLLYFYLCNYHKMLGFLILFLSAELYFLQLVLSESKNTPVALVADWLSVELT